MTDHGKSNHGASSHAKASHARSGGPNRDWKRQAACRGIDAEVFYPDPDDGGTEEGVDAKAVCGRCPVQAPCLEWALTMGEKEGVWGGRTERERRRLLRQRRRSA